MMLLFGKPLAVCPPFPCMPAPTRPRAQRPRPRPRPCLQYARWARTWASTCMLHTYEGHEHGEIYTFLQRHVCRLRPGSILNPVSLAGISPGLGHVDHRRGALAPIFRPGNGAPNRELFAARQLRPPGARRGRAHARGRVSRVHPHRNPRVRRAGRRALNPDPPHAKHDVPTSKRVDHRRLTRGQKRGRAFL